MFFTWQIAGIQVIYSCYTSSDMIKLLNMTNIWCNRMYCSLWSR